MCRNIRVLHHFEPPTTPEEIHAAALQYVRKVSGLTTPAKTASPEVARAVEAVARATARLLEQLPERGSPRTREGERERAKARWMSREARIVSVAKAGAAKAGGAKTAGAKTASAKTAGAKTSAAKAGATKTASREIRGKASTATTSPRSSPARERPTR